MSILFRQLGGSEAKIESVKLCGESNVILFMSICSSSSCVSMPVSLSVTEDGEPLTTATSRP